MIFPRHLFYNFFNEDLFNFKAGEKHEKKIEDIFDSIWVALFAHYIYVIVLFDLRYEISNR